MVENANGTWTITWNLADLPAPNSSSTVTFRTVAEDSYTTGGGPVAANDGWTNSVSLASTSAVITANDGSTTSLPIDDASSAGQSAGGITILKEVSVPQAGTLTCGDGSGISAWNATASGDYRPGDRVCWRLTVDFPGLLDTLNINIADLLPAGFTFESTTFGANHDATGFSFDGATPVPTWSATNIDIGGEKFEAIISSMISDPAAAGDGDILANLMKVTYTNTAGSVFQLRDQADATWAEPELALDKGVITVNGSPVPDAPDDGVGVQGGDLVRYQIAVTNTGSIDALATSVRDVLPIGITCAEVGSITAPGACSAADGWIQWDGMTVAAGATLSLTYDVTIPSGVAAGAGFDNVAGVRRYESPTNRPSPNDTQEYVPSSNIDPTLEINANVEPASDPSDVYVATATISKSRTTSIVEAGNNADQATIGETITYTITAVIPQGTTLYGPFTLTDAISGRLTHAAGTATATLNGVALPTAGMTLTDTGTNLTVSMVPAAAYTNAAGTGDDTIVISFSAVVDDEATNRRVAGPIPNTATLQWEDAAGNPAPPAEGSADTPVVEPNLTITKTDNDADGVLDPGQDVVFTVTTTNTSGTRVSTAHDLVVVDTVPAELTPLEGPGDLAEDGDTIPSSGGLWDEGLRTITWTVSSLAPGASSPLTYTARANNPLLGSSTITNTAAVTGSSLAGNVPGERDATSPNGGPGSGYQATVENTLTAPALGITKAAAPATATVGEVVEYTLDVTIPAGVIVYDVTVIDDLPPGVIYSSTTGSSCAQGVLACSPLISVSPIGSDGDAVAWFLGDLGTAAAADRVVTIVYEAYLDDAGAVTGGATLTNTAVVVGNQTNQPGVPAGPPDPAAYDVTSPIATSDVDVVEPTLTINKDVAGQVDDTDNRRAVPGDTLTYSVIVENTGSSAAWDIDVTDTPDPDLLLVDVPSGAGYTVVDGNPSDGTLAWTINGPLAAGDSFTLTYQLRVPPGFDESNEVAGPEFVNTADVPHYFGVDPALHDAGRTYRDYDDVDDDIVSIEADLASIGDRVWFDVDDDGVQDPGRAGAGRG